MKIRSAGLGDIQIILNLIRDLAIYEKEEAQAQATSEQLQAALFDTHPTAYCELVEESNGEVVGFALWFKNFSTWTGTPGIYLEDLFIQPDHRGKGFGKALLIHLARKCIENGWHRFQWWVLDWNESSISFYKSLGAIPMDEWTTFRVSGPALEKLAALPLELDA
jgi:GNAT superfamily N-acetyltransferase